jgi:hypothetical protein
MLKKSSYNWSTQAFISLVLLVVAFSSDAEAGCWFPLEPIFSVEEYDDVRCKDMSSIDSFGQAEPSSHLVVQPGNYMAGTW